MAATSRGIDVSNHQAVQDWPAVAAGGVTFAFIKATEGEHTHDARYRAHMDGILSVPSLLPGAYHYAHPNQDAHAEADNYIGVVRDDADRHAGFVHWLDLERATDGSNYAGRTSAQIRAWAEAWITRVRAAFPHQRVGVYTSGSDIAAGRCPRNGDALWYPAYPAGAMSYTAAEQRTRPAPSGVKCLFWQFTSTPLDRSICYLTPDALRAWAGAPTTVREDDMPTAAEIAAAVWNHTETAGKGSPAVRMGAVLGWMDTVHSNQNTALKQAVAEVAALKSVMAAMQKDGGLTAEQAEAAGKAGAQAALAELADAITADVPAPTKS